MRKHPSPGRIVVNHSPVSISLIATLYGQHGYIVSHMWAGYNCETRGLWDLELVQEMSLPCLKLFKVKYGRKSVSRTG